MPRPHLTCPAELVETTYFRIYRDRLADVPMHNPALCVEAVDFQIWQGHWLGVLVAPWCMSILLLPGKADGWETPGDNERRFVQFPVGPMAFLGNHEPDLGEFQSCALFANMAQFTTQAEAVQAARAALLALFKDPNKPPPPARAEQPVRNPQLSRRQLFGLK